MLENVSEIAVAGQNDCDNRNDSSEGHEQRIFEHAYTDTVMRTRLTPERDQQLEPELQSGETGDETREIGGDEGCAGPKATGHE